MQRFVYTPRVQAFIKLDDNSPNRNWKTLDVSKDIVSGSVMRQLNAVSTANLTLQNKFGRYTSANPIRPMDRIVILMSRIGDPFLVFTGYVDEAPYYQIHPGTVTISASCTLKILQYTFFDPGVPFLQQYFARMGYSYDYSTGALSDPNHGVNPQFEPFVGTGIGAVMGRTLKDIANWQSEIDIGDIPVEFLEKIIKVAKEDDLAVRANNELVLARYKSLLGIQDPTTPGSTSNGGITIGAGDPGQILGTISGVKVAQYAMAAGFTKDALLTAVKIAIAESSLRSNAVSYSTSDNSYGFGVWQIESTHVSNSLGSNLPAPNGIINPPTVPWDEWLKVKPKLPPQIQAFAEEMFDPYKCAIQTYKDSKQGTDFSIWSSISKLNDPQIIKDAQSYIQQASLLGLSGLSTTTLNVGGGEYGALVGSGLTFAGVDQGIDFTGAGDIYALADGTVTRLVSGGTGWSGDGALLVYQTNLEYNTKPVYIYVAEDFVAAPGITLGRSFLKGSVIGHATGSGHAPGIEVGYANSFGFPVAPLPAPRPANQWTQPGEDFKTLVKTLSQTNSVTVNPTGGTLPSGLPTDNNSVSLQDQAVPKHVDVASLPKFVYPINNAVQLFKNKKITDLKNYGEARSARGGVPAHTHQGDDISAPEGTLLVACVDGKLTTAYEAGGAGNYVTIVSNKTGAAYVYMHLKDPGSTVKSGSIVTRGQPIGYVGSTGESTGPHLHFEYHPSGGGAGTSPTASPYTLLDGAINNGGITTETNTVLVGAGTGTSTPVTSGNVDPNQPIDAKTAASIGLQSAWFTLQLSGQPNFTNEMLYTGTLALANDISFLGWMNDMATAAGRVFQSKPNGDFFAFFPDKFGNFKETPYFHVSEIEILDLTINKNDTNLITHLFSAGNLHEAAGAIGIADIESTRVASVESTAFPHFIGVNIQDPLSPKDPNAFDAVAFLKKFGARPKMKDFEGVTHPILLWMAAWMTFTELWSQQYTSEARMTFLPELFPGGLVDFGGKVTMYVDSVTHSFDLAGGFTTSADLSAPSSTNKGFAGGGLPITGGNYVNDVPLRDPRYFGSDLAKAIETGKTQGQIAAAREAAGQNG